MSYTDTRADRPLTRRRYPSSNITLPSEAGNNGSSGALVPVPNNQAATHTGANSSVAMDRYMAYMDLGQLLEHNLDALFPAADELLSAHQAVAGQNSIAYRNYLMEIEDGGLIGPNGPQIFAQMPPIDMRPHQRTSRGNSRILRNFVLMDGRNNNETSGSTRKSSTYHNNFPDYSNAGHNDNESFLCNFDTKSSTDPFTSLMPNQSSVDDVNINPKWQGTVPCKFKLNEIFQSYKTKEANEELDPNQTNFAKELFFAAMFYVDDENEEYKPDIELEINQ